jgi:hypothetical protein
MKKLVLLLLTTLPLVGHAATTLPQGKFGLDPSDNPKEVVFVIDGTDADIQVNFVQEHTVDPGKVLDTVAKTTLWQKMSLGDKGIEESTCVKAEMQVFCHIPAELHSANDAFSRLKSDYFHYDPLTGITSLMPL